MIHALFLSGLLQAAPSEAEHYAIETFAVPEDVSLEVSGMAFLEDGRLMLCTRRGEVFLVEGTGDDPAQLEDPEDPEAVRYRRYLDGLQEPLGLLVHGGWVYCVQRGEVSRFRDVDGDGRADELETVCDAWQLGGNYHEYNFGPRLDAEGNLWITTNKPFGGQPFGEVTWRGFALRITPEGEMLPTACGLRSPAGVEISPFGAAFYTDNQGEWCGASKLSHLEPGDFHGHPYGLFSCTDPAWTYGPVEEPADGLTFPQAARTHPTLKLPAVWFPYDKMGKSPAGMAWDTSGGAFGPFEGQLFVADQHHASVMRVFLEEVGGHWQGAAFPFREGFQCGIIRVAFDPQGRLLVGETNRGWGSKGNRTEGLERLSFRGRVPFEVHSMRAVPGGFRLRFTRALDAASARAVESYSLSSYTYLLHSPYGSPEVESEALELKRARVSPDRLEVELTIEGLRAGFVHELHLDGVRDAQGAPLLHSEAYYTLIELAH